MQVTYCLLFINIHNGGGNITSVNDSNPAIYSVHRQLITDVSLNYNNKINMVQLRLFLS